MKRRKVLFVCTGNTCRSPMAEALLRNEIKGRKIKWWDVSSCGIHADVGGKMSANAESALKEIGLGIKDFKPKQITQKLIESATVVVTMTDAQKQLLDGCGNVIAFKEICGYDIPDPYGCGLDVYRATRDALDLACHRIVENYILKYEE